MTTRLDRTVAITGGARGIGAATARMFARTGARVSIGDLDSELAVKTAAEIAAETGTSVLGLGLDVTDRTSFQAFLEISERELGPLDVLVNNAGIMPTGYFIDERDEVTDRLIDINLRGVITGSKLAGRLFADRGRGHLVNVASGAGMTSLPGIATYCATKFAVVGLNDALVQELEPHGVRVTTICPSFVNTELMSGLKPNAMMQKRGVIQAEDVGQEILRCVAESKVGVVTVPRSSAAQVKMLSLLPARLRNRMHKMMGMDRINLDADQAVRASYRARTEGELGPS